MKLQQKFEQAPEVYNSNYEVIKGYEKIADEFVIGFVTWCEQKNGNTASVKVVKELLESYKKENNL